MKEPAGDAVGDRVAAEAGLAQLHDGENAVEHGGEGRDPRVGEGVVNLSPL